MNGSLYSYNAKIIICEYLVFSVYSGWAREVTDPHASTDNMVTIPLQGLVPSGRSPQHLACQLLFLSEKGITTFSFSCPLSLCSNI